MEQKATQEKMIAEYRTWFAIFLKCLSEIKVDAQIKAEYTEEYRHKLTGMLVLMNGMKVITDEEYLTMYKEMEKEFNTERLYGFRYLMRTEVFHADRD
ncbi:hypothetical protein [Roseburia inulinivorans]|uniref:hypothetical protein n=1 Tax=Roseburia inulinivorans TaxID=360807 RepID=UPI0026740180|nr:hypothetical protein [Roseburia inulinivorans]